MRSLGTLLTIRVYIYVSRFEVCFQFFVLLLNRFTPSINAIIYHGDKKERDELRKKHMPRTVGPKFPIVITSYEVAMNDARKNLRHYPWKYVVIDEVILQID